MERNSPEGKSRMIRVITEEWEKRRTDGRYEEFCKTMDKVNKDPEKRAKAGSKIKDKWNNDIEFQTKMKNRKQGGRPKISIEIEGIIYSSLSEAVKKTNLSYHQLRKLAGLTK